jgi:hypothetical protein
MSRHFAHSGHPGKNGHFMITFSWICNVLNSKMMSKNRQVFGETYFKNYNIDSRPELFMYLLVDPFFSCFQSSPRKMFFVTWSCWPNKRGRLCWLSRHWQVIRLAEGWMDGVIEQCLPCQLKNDSSLLPKKLIFIDKHAPWRKKRPLSGAFYQVFVGVWHPQNMSVKSKP